MQSPHVVEPLEAVEVHRLGLRTALEAMFWLPIDQLGLQGGEEALRHGVVVAVAHGTIEIVSLASCRLSEKCSRWTATLGRSDTSPSH